MNRCPDCSALLVGDECLLCQTDERQRNRRRTMTEQWRSRLRRIARAVRRRRCESCGANVYGARCAVCGRPGARVAPDPYDLVDHPEDFTEEAARRRSRPKRRTLDQELAR